jgi:hypothetical protein
MIMTSAQGRLANQDEVLLKLSQVTDHSDAILLTTAHSFPPARYFRLGGNTLAAGLSHVITVNVSGPGGVSTTASSTITVLRSPLIAAIQGGNTLTTGVGRAITLDARPSQDPDVMGPNSYTTLNITWACIQGGDRYGAACGVALPPLARVVAGPFQPGSYLFTLTVTAVGGRVASAVRTVVVQGGSLPPRVSIRALAQAASRVDPRGKLALSGLVTTNASSSVTSNVTVTWSLASGLLAGGLALGDAATTPLAGGFVRQGPVTLPFALLLPGGRLVRSSSYVLRLTASQAGAGTAYAEVSELLLSGGDLYAEPRRRRLWGPELCTPYGV